jgi:hypothetical protein
MRQAGAGVNGVTLQAHTRPVHIAGGTAEEWGHAGIHRHEANRWATANGPTSDSLVLRDSLRNRTEPALTR